ncbi:MAG: hypothetical protein J6P73_05295 [Bacteroidales bacterium]|nr:hypothetical protein [Bacteroidales bacterium]
MNRFYLYRNAWRYDGASHKEPQLSKAESKALLRQGGLLVRNTYDFDCIEETLFWYVIKDHFESLDGLKNRVRNKIRHADRYFNYQLIPYDQFEKKVFPILEDTFAHYKVHDRTMNREVFSKYLEYCQQRQFDYWGIFLKDGGNMVGFCTVNNWGDCCEYGYTGVFSRYKSHGYYPYYGLYHHLNAYYLEEQGFHYVSDSARSITNHSEIQDFLIQNFNFRKAYCHLDVHYNWWMKFAVKTLYPFRKWIKNPNVKAVLNMESMTR